MRVDVTIIGGGPVGLFAAFYAGLRGMSVRIIDSLPELGGQLTALYPEKYVYDMPGFPKVLAKDLARQMAEQAQVFSPELVLGETATSLTKDEEGWVIGTAATSQPAPSSEYQTRTVIVSAGAGAFSPTKLGVPREDEFHGHGLLYGVKEKASLAGKRLVVVGGGDSAFDWCMNLEDTASEISLVHRRDVFKAHEESVRHVQASSVKMRLFEVVQELHGEGVLEAVTLQNTQSKETTYLQADAVIVNVGFKSSLGPLKEWGMEIDKTQIVVNERFETNLPGVYAVGDVCTFANKLKLIATGVGEATTAVCMAKMSLDPAAKLFPGHSSEMDVR
jgi:thioredoxin reductase (NADPH)